ncbi:hypothetical protein [Magnetospira sp. QH-2]|uniref:hypothetical protein n=1 Tax=Magnetospira sp. (strain QH-2) TaxID=1288970 RepID=UPI0003E80D77|nr:hypothetical protein [Magnetospira sp. QH-2]CCQ74245.1 protein of unknown function [Magnetospira sp. QH-2]
MDILVRPSETLSPPHLMAEAKLGSHNLPGVLEDINRIVSLLSMYELSGAFENNAIYGAVVFHIMREGANPNDLMSKASSFLQGIDAHGSTLTGTHTWLKLKSGLLSSSQIVEGVSGYQEYHDDGTVEDVFGKDQFAFMPGLVLVGNASDVENVNF